MIIIPPERRADLLSGGSWLWRDGGDHREPVRARQGADAVQQGQAIRGALYHFCCQKNPWKLYYVQLLGAFFQISFFTAQFLPQVLYGC